MSSLQSVPFVTVEASKNVLQNKFLLAACKTIFVKYTYGETDRIPKQIWLIKSLSGKEMDAEWCRMLKHINHQD